MILPQDPAGNRTMTVFKSITAAIFALALAATAAFGAGEQRTARDISFSFEGPFGAFDRGQLQRGFLVYQQVCSACHSMKLLHYRNLGQPGGPEFSAAEVQAIAAGLQVIDGPDDGGDMFERPGLPSDRLVSPFPNEQAARAANGGVLPPDLSLITKSRAGWEGSLATLYTTTLWNGIGGPEYVYSVLTGYEPTPPELADQQPDVGHYNPYFAAAPWIAMPAPLSDGTVTYGDGTEATIDQMARDVAAFLAWAAEPTMEERKRLGFQVLIYMAALTVLLYLIKNMIWSRLH
jgi:ubiquinol-cytochrome c reductase cytochrome b/c1 subunit